MEIIKIFENIFSDVRRYLKVQGNKDIDVVQKNPSGDISRIFDLKAEEIMIQHLKKEFPNSGIISEECGEIFNNINYSDNLFILDPVDGSFNFMRGLFESGCSIALLKNNGSMNLQNVTHGFVGNYITGDIYFAVSGLGAFKNYQNINCTNTKKVRNAIVGLNFDYNKPSMRTDLLKLIILPKKIRYMGAATIELCNVACGAYDAYIDIRDNLTPENFCAVQLIIKEAGGIFTDKFGDEIKIFSMRKKYSVIGSATMSLHQELIKKIKL